MAGSCISKEKKVIKKKGGLEVVISSGFWTDCKNGEGSSPLKLWKQTYWQIRYFSNSVAKESRLWHAYAQRKHCEKFYEFTRNPFLNQNTGAAKCQECGSKEDSAHCCDMVQWTAWKFKRLSNFNGHVKRYLFSQRLHTCMIFVNACCRFFVIYLGWKLN